MDKGLDKYSVDFVLHNYFINNRIQDSIAPINILIKNGIESIYQLKKSIGSGELRKIKMIGTKRFGIIVDMLEEFLRDLSEDENYFDDCKFWKYRKKKKK